jgi:hypothetical protein
MRVVERAEARSPQRVDPNNTQEANVVTVKGGERGGGRMTWIFPLLVGSGTMLINHE